MPTLTVVRGLSGSGKSTYAKSFGDFHVEADMFFMREGRYQWTADRLKHAHEWCFNTVATAMDAGMDVVVSNTFVRRWEFSRYLDYAKELNYDVKVIVCRNNYGNVHDVPAEALERMTKNWEDYEGEWSYYGELK